MTQHLKTLKNWFNLDEECIATAVNCLKLLWDLPNVNIRKHMKLVCVNDKTDAFYLDLKNSIYPLAPGLCVKCDVFDNSLVITFYIIYT